jgi:hypothetical protein
MIVGYKLLRIIRSVRGWGIIFVYAFYLYEAICPPMAFSRQADGTTNIEFELESSVCRCDHCPQCRERRLLELLEPWCPLTKMTSQHCLHDDIHLAADLSDSLAAAKKFILPAAAPAALAAEIGILESYHPAAGVAPGPSGLPPPGGSVLRC